MMLFNGNNLSVLESLLVEEYKVDIIYADCIYEEEDFNYLPYCYDVLKDNGIIIVQTDYHTVAYYYKLLDEHYDFVNWCIYINEWGGTPKKGFPRKHDDILIFSKGEDYYWDKSAIEIPKVTAGTKFDKKGTGMKTPCDVFYDHVSFSTVSKERVKIDNKNIQWQKPLWLMDRLIRPFTKEGDIVLDLFMGSGTLGVWCRDNKRDYIGIEIDSEIFKVAEKRIFNENNTV